MKWYQRIQIRATIFLIIVVTGIFCFALFFVLSNQINYRINSRMDEISRYAVLVASDIAMNQYIGNTGSSEYYEEVDSMAGFYQDARILVLNDQCRVLKDSANTRRGKTFINDDILTALSGQTTRAVEGIYGRIAVPILDYSDSYVVGVVYVSLSMERQYQEIQNSLDAVVLVLILIWIIICLLIGSVFMLSFKPLAKIRRWLRDVNNGHGEHPPLVRETSEYGAVVKSMDTIIADLKEADTSRKEFVSNVSHELKTPLSSIKVLTESLLLQKGAPEEIYREFLQDINSEIDRESALINDLLSLVRLEDSKSGLNLQMISMNDMAESILKRLQPLADRKQVELILENRGRVEAEVDEMKMTLALSNLVENGIKYNKEGGSVRLKVDSDFADAILTISDTGCGIAEEHFNKIYQRFYRVDKTRDRATGGTGLGLAIVHQIITMHHGSISIRSKEDVGTSFTVRIPLIAVQNAKNLAEKEEKDR